LLRFVELELGRGQGIRSKQKRFGCPTLGPLFKGSSVFISRGFLTISAGNSSLSLLATPRIRAAPLGGLRSEFQFAHQLQDKGDLFAIASEPCPLFVGLHTATKNRHNAFRQSTLARTNFSLVT
jgi:hypothetical protein